MNVQRTEFIEWHVRLNSPYEDNSFVEFFDYRHMAIEFCVMMNKAAKTTEGCECYHYYIYEVVV